MPQRFSIIFLLFFLMAQSAFAQPDVSLKQKIGQMLLMALPDNKMDTTSSFYKEVRDGHIAGIVIYERHLTVNDAAKNLKDVINVYQKAAPIPIFVTITQEGGVVNRLKTKYGFPAMPSAQYLGSLNNKDSTRFYADVIASTLAGLGINVNFAPVLDILVAGNPVLGSRERCFSDNTDIIVQHAAQMIESHRQYHVKTVVKHFPGHGSSTHDSHLGLTDVSNTWKPYELEPYRALIEKGKVDAVMTAHIVNTQLDGTKLPATLSEKVITGILRKDLGFDGVVFSDDMLMKAISAEYGLKDALEKAINAGVDVLLFSGTDFGGTIISASIIMETIQQLVSEQRISEKRIDESYERIRKMKASMLL